MTLPSLPRLMTRWMSFLRASHPPEHLDAIGMKLVLIPAGEFLMGSAGSDPYADAHEKPRHPVRITQPFYLGVTPVTQAQYERVMGQNPSRFQGDAQRPVECVSWEDAVAFCGRLTKLEAQTYRLPTEAEWEYACRAGSGTLYGFGDDPSALGDHAWYGENSGGTTHPVMQKKPNAWGLYDMHGNVYQWCADWYAADWYARSPAEDPAGPDSGSTRVLRGGCWRNRLPALLRCACRLALPPTFRFDYRGFRVVRTLRPETAELQPGG